MLFLPPLLTRLAVKPETKPPILLSVDVTDTARDTLRAHEVIPAKPGHMELVYPQWIPGEHRPAGPINQIFDLHFSSGGKEIPWRRDDVDMFAFHVDVPEGQSDVTVDLAESAPTGSNTAPNMAWIVFSQLLLYPAKTRSDDVPVHAKLVLPSGWKYATALHTVSGANDADFKTVSLTRLVDSPALCGEHFNKQILNTGPGPVHEIDMAGDNEACIQMPAKTAAGYASLVAEARTFFGATHYNEYHWLVPVSSTLHGHGLEHHESSEDGAGRNVFKGDEGRVGFAGLLAHEYTHSWCGKYRRPAGLATPNYQEPMKGELLYVYEGFTQFVGTILPPRAGLWTKDEFLADLARTAASLDHTPGRSWRNLQDTAIASSILRGVRDGWRTDRRGQDYYQEAVLIWLEADMVIRQQSEGKKSIDDFAKAFFGPPTTGPELRPYTFEDVVKALEGVQPYDWRTFLRTRLDGHGPGAPLGGITMSGWTLTYTEKPSSVGARPRDASYPFSLGVNFDAEGTVTEIERGGPADLAGLSPGQKVLTVEGKLFGATANESLMQRIDDALAAHKPFDVTVAIGEDVKTLHINYADGDKFPKLVRDETKPDLLSAVIAAHAK